MSSTSAERLAELLPRLHSLVHDLEEVLRNGPGFTPTEYFGVEQWALDVRGVLCVSGQFFGHPTIRDGHLACSSEIFFVTDDERYVRTLSRWYKLGTPSETGRPQ